MFVTGGQGVAGSNPAVPTARPWHQARSEAQWIDLTLAAGWGLPSCWEEFGRSSSIYREINFGCLRVSCAVLPASTGPACEAVGCAKRRGLTAPKTNTTNPKEPKPTRRRRDGGTPVPAIPLLFGAHQNAISTVRQASSGARFRIRVLCGRRGPGMLRSARHRGRPEPVGSDQDSPARR